MPVDRPESSQPPQEPGTRHREPWPPEPLPGWAAQQPPGPPGGDATGWEHDPAPPGEHDPAVPGEATDATWAEGAANPLRHAGSGGDAGPSGGVGDGAEGRGRRRRRRWTRRVTFRSRLSLLAAAAVGIAVALAAVASYFVVQNQLYTQTDNNLADQVSNATSTGPDGSVLRVQQLARTGRLGDTVQLIDQSGQVVYCVYQGLQCTQAIPVTKADIAFATPGATGDSRFTTADVRGTQARVLIRGLGAPVFGGYSFSGLALQVAQPLTLVNHTLAHLQIILALVALAGIALAVMLGYLAAKAMIRPVERLTGAVEHVTATQDLGATIDEEGEDELARLAHSFNAMLNALGASRQQQAQLVADAGHELRTPLTSLRTNIEVLMRTPDLPTADRDQLLGDVKAQLEELTTLVGDLVDLAREDEQEPEPVDVRFDDVVVHAVERAKRRAPSLTFQVKTDFGMVRAQPALLERAVLNVLDNAAKWSPPGGQVDVHLRRGDVWYLDVRDRGPGIAPDDLPRVFDRFYRAPAARSMPGSGLGLSIVRQVVETHGGRVSASCPPGGGTLVHIELPIVAEDAPPPSWLAAPLPDAPASSGGADEGHRAHNGGAGPEPGDEDPPGLESAHSAGPGRNLAAGQ